MLKFVMDALQGVVYENDVTITTVVCTKNFAEDADAVGWTDVHFSTASHAPPLAAGLWV